MTKECRDRLLIRPVFEDNSELGEFLLLNAMTERRRDKVGCVELVLIGDETPCEYIVIIRKGE